MVLRRHYEAVQGVRGEACRLVSRICLESIACEEVITTEGVVVGAYIKRDIESSLEPISRSERQGAQEACLAIPSSRFGIPEPYFWWFVSQGDAEAGKHVGPNVA